jgi:homoserine dehydrogenase
MFEDKLDFNAALLLAKQLGFAESNPKLDVEGYDAVNKWAILLNHAYGIVEHPDNILFTGIQNIQLTDALVAKEKGLDIKLIAQAKKLNSADKKALPQHIYDTFIVGAGISGIATAIRRLKPSHLLINLR